MTQDATNLLFIIGSTHIAFVFAVLVAALPPVEPKFLVCHLNSHFLVSPLSWDNVVILSCGTITEITPQQRLAMSLGLRFSL